MYPTKRLLLQNLTIWKGNGEESILTLYFHGGTTGMTWLFSTSSRWKNNLYNQSHWKSERKNQKVHEIKAFIPFGRCRKKDRISFAHGNWKEMDNAHFKLELDYEPIYAYFWKQDSDIRRNLQLNPVSIYTKFWTVSAIASERPDCAMPRGSFRARTSAYPKSPMPQDSLPSPTFQTVSKNFMACRPATTWRYTEAPKNRKIPRVRVIVKVKNNPNPLSS